MGFMLTQDAQELVASDPPRRRRRRRERALVTDGPFAESKEMIIGARPADVEPRPQIGRAPEVDSLHGRIVARLAAAGVGAHDCDLDALAESMLADAIAIAAVWIETPRASGT